MSDTMTPPPGGDPVAPPEVRSAMPTVLGVLGIIWASFGLLCNFTNFLGAQFVAWSFIIVTFVLTLLLSLWLLLGSINLLRRKRSGRSQLLSWAVVEIIVIIAMTVWSLAYVDQMTNALVQQEMEALEALDAAAHPDAEAADSPQVLALAEEEMRQFIQIGLYGFTGCSAVLYMVWPVLLLILLNTSGLRRDMETWEPEGFEGHEHA